jgi:YD repeat-containing protein
MLRVKEASMRRGVILSTLSLLAPIVCALSLTAQGGTVRYIYDELGRLVGVVDTNGDAAAYHYDPVGNLLSITRSTSTQVAIIEFGWNGAILLSRAVLSLDGPAVHR